jgi:hypothetical protein
MGLKEKFASQSRSAQVLGTVAAICTVLPAIALAGLIAFRTFWWCPEGGCPLASWTDKAMLLTNVSGLIVLIVFFSLILQFPFVFLARPFCSRSTAEEAFLQHAFPMLGWHDALMRKWVGMLWQGRQ